LKHNQKEVKNAKNHYNNHDGPYCDFLTSFDDYSELEEADACFDDCA
jgi:hypothetical protein